jgi:hypothetical protein
MLMTFIPVTSVVLVSAIRSRLGTDLMGQASVVVAEMGGAAAVAARQGAAAVVASAEWCK